MWSCLYVPNSPRGTNSSCRIPQLPLVREKREKKKKVLTHPAARAAPVCLFPSLPGLDLAQCRHYLQLSTSARPKHVQGPVSNILPRWYQHLNFNRDTFPPSLSLQLRIASKKPTPFPQDKSWQNPNRFCR